MRTIERASQDGTIARRSGDVIDLALWASPAIERDEAPSGAAAAIAFVAFLGFATGLGVAALVLL